MRRNYGTSFRLYHPSDFVTWQTTSVQALYLIKFLENFHSQNIIERNTIEEMAQNLFTTLLHKTICVVMSAGVIIAYDTEKLSFKCYMITSGLKVAISHLKKWHFSMGVLGNSWSSVWELAILLGVCLIHDCARVANGDSIKNYKLASFFEKQNILFVYSGISIYPGFLKGLICLIIHFTGFIHLSQCIIVLILPFPRVLHYKSLAENPWPQVLLKMMNMCLLT